MTRNLTLAIDDDLLDKVRVLAAMKRTSVNEMVRGFLTRLVEQEVEHDEATQELLKLIDDSDGDMGDYFASLAKVRARNFDTLWPTHGAPVRDVAPFIDAYVAHRRAREAQIL
jgi:plasmid stability protein